MKDALGLIEVKGLATAILVADTLVKVAAVELVGIEPAKGSGWMTVKVTGDVGAVNAAIDAGGAKASELQMLVSKKVIPRLGESLESHFLQKNLTPSVMKKEETIKAPVKEEIEVTASMAETISDNKELEIEKRPEEVTDEETKDNKKALPKKDFTKKSNNKKK